MLKTVTKFELPKSVRDLVDAHKGLDLNDAGIPDGGDDYLFVRMDHDQDVTPPGILPSITHAGSIYFLVPSRTDLPAHWRKLASPCLSAEVAYKGEGFVPEDEYWPNDNQIGEALESHRLAVYEAKRKRKARELLSRERNPLSGLYASAARIDDATPMLIEGLMRERGVSVVYGDFDEFKTTLVLDMMAHVAMGATWQGRQAMPRPVIWYALEGADEMPVRLRALEAGLKEKSTPWGGDRAPITVLDRIPETYREWRAEISRTASRWETVYDARTTTMELPTEICVNGNSTYESVRYPVPDTSDGRGPVIVIDTLSIALGGEDEKGPRAAGFIHNCLDLLKARPDFRNPYEDDDGYELNAEKSQKWYEDNGFLNYPVASHVIVIHHQTKTGIDFAGHRAIAANTQGLYRVHRFGKITDAARPYAGQLTPMRVKGIPRPSPIRFQVDVVPVEGTKQTAAILKDKTTTVAADLAPIVASLRQLENPEAIPPVDLNECLDVIAASGVKDGAAKRKARQRLRDKLEMAGVVEPVEDENGKVAFYRFHGAI